MGIGPAGIGQTSAPTQTGNGATAAAPGTPPGGQLGENAFLQLLVAQLKYQDPMQPVDNTQFVTQLAQFQMLNVLSDIKADMDKLAAAGGAATTGAPASGTATGSPAPGGGSSGAGGAGSGG